MIQTVLGPIPPDALGVTDSHDHLFIRGGMPVLLYSDFRLADYEKALQEVDSFRQAGGDAIVEMSPIDWGRDVTAMIRLAQETGLQIIATTGFHKVPYYLDTHWIHHYSDEALAELVCAELRDGIDIHNYTGPLVQRSPAKAGAIKVATQRACFTDVERKLLRVAAFAHLGTGYPIMTHRQRGPRDRASAVSGRRRGATGAYRRVTRG